MNKTIEFFKEIAKIPRESGNEKEISDYICRFAEERNLEYIQDKYNNVIIKKNTGHSEPIILQAHLDMVCEKEKDLQFDFEKQGIEVIEENGYLKANGTTLGADNGIGVAQILNILDSDIEANIEAVFTVSEETTMIGAENIDVSMLKGKQMINLDGFEEHTIINESAGFVDIIIKTNYKYTDSSDNLYKVSVEGMEGGHSGFDIDKNRGNSSIVLANLLKKIDDIQLSEFIGGTKFNVIPSQAECYFSTNLEFEELLKIINKYRTEIKEKYKNINIILEKITEKNKAISKVDSIHFLDSISNFKNGVYFKNENKKPIMSVNLGVVNLRENIMKIGFRSSREEEKKKGIEILESYCRDNNFELVILSSQPGFETKPETNLIQKLVKSYKETINEEGPDIKSVHITVESGFFKEKIPGLEVAIISPKILGAHSTNECVEVKSIIECDNWIKRYLKV